MGGKEVYTANISVMAGFGECSEDWDVGCC